MPAQKDETRWETVEGDHGDDVTYSRRLADPDTQPTDEVRTQQEIEQQAQQAPEQSEESAPEGVNATKAAYEYAVEQGIDISTLSGTGLDGKVTKPDVEAAVEARG